MWGVSLTYQMLILFLSGEFLLHIPSWLYFVCGEFLLHVPCWLVCFHLGSFSSTSHGGFISIWGVSMSHPVLAFFSSFFCGEFLLHIPCWGFLFYFSSGEFPLHVLCWRNFYLGNFLTHPVLASFPITGVSLKKSHVGFFFLIWGVSLTHPELASFLFGSFS